MDETHETTSPATQLLKEFATTNIRPAYNATFERVLFGEIINGSRARRRTDKKQTDVFVCECVCS